MSGRPKKVVRVYERYNGDSKNGKRVDGFKRVDKIGSIAEFCSLYFPERSGGLPELSYGSYIVLSKDKIASTVVLNDKECRRLCKRETSKHLVKGKPREADHLIEMLDIDGNRIATFKNPLMASVILNVDPSIIHSSLDIKSAYNKVDYTFKTIQQ